MQVVCKRVINGSTENCPLLSFPYLQLLQQILSQFRQHPVFVLRIIKILAPNKVKYLIWRISSFLKCIRNHLLQLSQ